MIIQLVEIRYFTHIDIMIFITSNLSNKNQFIADRPELSLY